MSLPTYDMPGLVVQCHTLHLVPRPFGPPPPPPKNNFVDDWLLSRPKCAVSPRPKRSYIGNSRPFVNPDRSTRRPIHKFALLLSIFDFSDSSSPGNLSVAITAPPPTTTTVWGGDVSKSVK
ncbi:hypothetical protein B0H10DRAFT_1963907 [Mycena sp. CBHHK59/15]|nr:hypothetical protein B0H10DRAFT_1963907 [Mycena sp. CBHHK59/15]